MSKSLHTNPAVYNEEELVRKPIIYVILNGELKMSPGKAAAQAVHAVTAMVGTLGKELKFKYEHYERTVIVLEAENQQQILNLQEYLVGAGLYSAYYIDEGANEVGPYSITALAVEPFSVYDDTKRDIFNPFPLYAGEDNMKEVTQKYLRMVSRNYKVPSYVRKTLEWLD